MKYSPGPWIRRNNSVYREDEWNNPDRYASLTFVATVMCNQFNGQELTTANACLIAAAPELLEACKKAKFILDQARIATKDNAYGLAVDYFAEVIAKAEGKL